MFALMAMGLVLRVIQYAANCSLWLDELSLARNIVHRPLGTLILQPLGYDQVAPIGFLAVEKLIGLALGTGDLALRLFPFLCGLAVLPLMALVARRALGGLAAPMVVGLVATGALFVHYTAEVKQYSCDVVAALVLSFLALRLRERQESAKACLIAGLVGAGLVWFSQVAVFVVAGIGAAIALCWIASRGRQWGKPAWLTVPIWAMASVAAIVVGLHHLTVDTTAYMHRYWQIRFGFPPPHAHGQDLPWLWNRLVELFNLMGYFNGRWYVGLAALGVGVVWRRDRFVALLFAAPLVVTALAGVAQQYPFRGRLVLFLLPGILLFVAAAVQWLAGLATRGHAVLGRAALVVLLAEPVLGIGLFHPPYELEDYKRPLAAMQQERRPGDRVYVFPVAYEGVERYGPQYGLYEGDYVLGECRNTDLRAYLKDVDAFRGAARVWIVSAGFREARETLMKYADAIGVRRGGLATRTSAAVLYDFSDATRLEAVSSDRFPLLPLSSGQPGICRAWSRPDPK